MRQGRRKSTPKVVGGKVRRKNRGARSGSAEVRIDREAPGPGCRHVVTKSDVRDFIDLIPDWERLSEGLESILLARSDVDGDGYYEFFIRDGTSRILLCAWNADLWIPLWTNYYEEHRELLERIGVACEKDEDGESVTCRFTEARAKAFSLLHVFLHELGHHHQRQRLRHRSSRLDEDYAERFANRHADEMFAAYVESFGQP
jgi:hypothetical protein